MAKYRCKVIKMVTDQFNFVYLFEQQVENRWIYSDYRFYCLKTLYYDRIDAFEVIELIRQAKRV